MKESAPFRTKSSETRVAPPAVREVLRSQGKPLDAETRRAMEPHFGHDFGHVRVHTDQQAAASADAVDARAYAAGANIVFARDQFAPKTKPGQELIAHELAHTVQQRNSGSSTGPLPIADPGGNPEREADHAAKAVTANRPAAVTASATTIARQPADPGAKETAAPTNAEQLEQALIKFLKAVKRAYPKESLPRNQIVVFEARKLAAASKAPYRGPVPTLSPEEEQRRMEEFLNSIAAPTEPEPLAKAIAQHLPGPVPSAVIEHLQNRNVFKPSKPGVAQRWLDMAPPDLPAGNPQDVLDQQRQDAAMATQRSNPKFSSPPLDPLRIGKAVAGPEEKEKKEYKDPAPKPAEREGVVNTDIKIPSIAPTITVDKAVHFKVNEPGSPTSDDKTLQASLAPGGAGDLDMLIRWLRAGPEYAVQLTGMASVEGPQEFNKQLGENRVQSVARALLRAGVGAAQIDDVPGRAETCTRLSFGIYNCGDTRASKTVDPSDRRVQALLFARPKSTKP